MAQRVQYESSSDVGVFATLTNSYCLTAMGGSQNFFSVFEVRLLRHEALWPLAAGRGDLRVGAHAAVAGGRARLSPNRLSSSKLTSTAAP